MKVKRMLGAAALVVFSLGSVAAGAQAYTVATDGKVQQEKEPPVIAPENQPTTEQLTKLFEAMRIKQQMQSMRQIVPTLVQQQIQTAMKQTEQGLPAGSKLTPEQRQRMQEVMSKYVGKAMDLYPTEEMFTDIGAIYQRHLSKDDVDGMIAFYTSPAGQHLLDAQPVIAQEFMPVVMKKVSERGQAMMKEMMKEMAEIAPSTKPSSAQPGAKPATAKPPAN